MHIVISHATGLESLGTSALQCLQVTQVLLITSAVVVVGAVSIVIASGQYHRILTAKKATQSQNLTAAISHQRHISEPSLTPVLSIT